MTRSFNKRTLPPNDRAEAPLNFPQTVEFFAAPLPRNVSHKNAGSKISAKLETTYDDPALDLLVLLLEEPDLDARLLHRQRKRGQRNRKHEETGEGEERNVWVGRERLTLWRKRKMGLTGWVMIRCTLVDAMTG